MTSNYTIITMILATTILLSCSNQTGTNDEINHNSDTETIQELKIENLLRDELALADSLEVIVSYLEVPKNTTLPMHYHPGEEFAYIIEGSGEVSLEGQPSTKISAGNASKIPLKMVHTFSTQEESAKIVVFRVHQKGKPDRMLVEDPGA